MSAPSCSTELKVVLAVIVVVLGWIFAAMIPKDDGQKQIGFHSSPLQKTLSDTPKEGTKTFCYDGNENFGYLADDQAHKPPYFFFSLLKSSRKQKTEREKEIQASPENDADQGKNLRTPSDDSGKSGSLDGLNSPNESAKDKKDDSPESLPGRREEKRGNASERTEGLIPLDPYSASQYQTLWGSEAENKDSADSEEIEITNQPFLFGENGDLTAEGENGDLDAEEQADSQAWAKELEIKTEEPPVITPVEMPDLQDSILDSSAPAENENTDEENSVSPPEESLADEFMKSETMKEEESQKNENLQSQSEENGETAEEAAKGSETSETSDASEGLKTDEMNPAWEGKAENREESKEASGSVDLIEMNPKTPSENGPTAAAQNGGIENSSSSSETENSLIETRPNSPSENSASSQNSASSPNSGTGEAGTPQEKEYRQLIPSSEPIREPAPQNTVRSADYSERSGDSTGNISPAGALVPYAPSEVRNPSLLPAPSGNGVSSLSSPQTPASVNRPVTSSQNSAIRSGGTSSLSSLPSVKTYLVENESWGDIVQKFQLTPDENAYYKNLNRQRMRADATIPSGTRIILPRR